jgi:hypothetical protein
VVGFHPVDKPQAGIVKFVHNEDSYIDHARALNAVGYLVRQTSARLLAGAIREVHRKTAFFTSQAPLSRLNPRTVAAAGAEHSLAFSAAFQSLRWFRPAAQAFAVAGPATRDLRWLAQSVAGFPACTSARAAQKADKNVRPTLRK